MGRYLRLKNIRVADVRDSSHVAEIAIYFSRGLIIGFTLNRNAFRPDPATVDVTRVRLEYLDAPDPEVEALIDSRDRELLNWSDIFEIDLDEKTYYHLKDIGDGDFIAMDENGQVYEITHDPFKIKPLSGDLADIFSHY